MKVPNHQKLTTHGFKRVLKHWSREEKEKGRINDTRGYVFKKDLNHTIILCCNIISRRDEKKSAEETEIAKCDSDCSNMKKK